MFREKGILSYHLAYMGVLEDKTAIQKVNDGYRLVHRLEFFNPNVNLPCISDNGCIYPSSSLFLDKFQIRIRTYILNYCFIQTNYYRHHQRYYSVIRSVRCCATIAIFLACSLLQFKHENNISTTKETTVTTTSSSNTTTDNNLQHHHQQQQE